MQMHKYYCCEKCMEQIAKSNTNAAKLWMDLCALRLKKCEWFRMHSQIEELRVLENNGFVLSTENSFHVWVKMNGHFSNDDGDNFFCLLDGRHG